MRDTVQLVDMVTTADSFGHGKGGAVSEDLAFVVWAWTIGCVLGEKRAAEIPKKEKNKTRQAHENKKPKAHLVLDQDHQRACKVASNAHHGQVDNVSSAVT